MFWDSCLPEDFLHRVRIPVQFEIHEEESLGARKILGYDRAGIRCFYFHEFLLTEERFDEEEDVFEAASYRETIFGWKTLEEGWLKLKASAESAWGRKKTISTHFMQKVSESELER